jgi:exopolysaccharide biosynthesis polyprenyl glycosylphosphotransferase
MPDEVLEKLTVHQHESTARRPGTRRRARGSTGLSGPAFGAVRRAFPILEAPAPAEIAIREGLYRRYLGATDCLAGIVSLLVVTALWGQEILASVLLAGPLMVLMNKLAGLYERDELVLKRSTLDEVPAILQLTGVFSLVVTVLQSLLFAGTLGAAQIATLWATTFLLTAGGRMLARRAAAQTAAVERCLVIGDESHAARVRERLESSGVQAAVVATLPLAGDDARAIGGPDQVRRIVRQLDIHRVIIAPVSTDSSAVVELIRIAKAVGVRVSVLPRMFEVVGSFVEFEDIDGMTMLGIRRFGLTRSSHLLKRAFDLVGSSLILLAVAPLMALIALAIRVDSRGSVFFRQTRVGRDGKHFDIIKFRSMDADAEARKQGLRDLNQAGDGLFKIVDDPRITRIGHLLRRTSLDELPQLLNVVKGEMSLVGPRPLVVDEDALVHGLDRSRLHLTPGMTGPWQVLGSTRVPMSEMVAIDYLYVASWTLWTDVKILVRTVGHVFGRSGV